MSSDGRDIWVAVSLRSDFVFVGSFRLPAAREMAASWSRSIDCSVGLHIAADQNSSHGREAATGVYSSNDSEMSLTFW